MSRESSLRERGRQWLREYRIAKARRLLFQAGRGMTLHEVMHLVAALDVMDATKCDDTCSIETIGKRMHQRLANAVVPDVIPEAWT